MVRKLRPQNRLISPQLSPAKTKARLKIVPLYKQFFLFLEAIEKGATKWPSYWRLYYFPYRRFFEAYFSLFPLLDRQALIDRVEAVRPEHYSRLRFLLQDRAAEKILQAIHQRCFRFALPGDVLPVEVYLLIGFFSPVAFILRLGQKKVIVFGLERFRDLSLLDIFYVHEYAHLLLQRHDLAIPAEKKGSWFILAEGLACWFSTQVLPERPLTDHLFLRRDRLNWCWQNEARLRQLFTSYASQEEKIVYLEQQGDASLGLPPRTLHFLGFKAVEEYARSQNLRATVFFSEPERLLELEI